MRSEIAPIGMDRISRVTPKDANNNPIIAGPASNRAAKSGRTGTETEYATRSVNVAVVMHASTTPRDRTRRAGDEKPSSLSPTKISSATFQHQASERRQHQRKP